MANLITLSRLLLLIVIVAIAYRAPPLVQLINVPLLILVFVTDGLDGYVARKRGEASVFGAMFDIAGDRIVELTMWIVLSDLTYLATDLPLVPIWVPLVFVIRGIIVDTIRANQVTTDGKSPFDMIRTGIGQWIVGGKFMRIFYAVLKAHAFCWLLLMRPMPELLPGIWLEWSWLTIGIGNFLVYLSVLICVARALPVVAEFLYLERKSLLPRGQTTNADR